jgi:uncharacterized protein YdaU (DUF1376 family)
MKAAYCSTIGTLLMDDNKPVKSAHDAPWFQFYAKDWLADEACTLMTPEVKGAYIDLLARAWASDPPCTLPDDDEALAKLSGLGVRWPQVAAQVRTQFEALDGRLRARKLVPIHAEMVAQHAHRSRAGLAGNKKRWDRIGLPAGDQAHAARTAIAPRSQSEPDSEPNANPDGQQDEDSDPDADWPNRLAAEWKNEFGGEIPHGQARAHLGPLVREHGVEEVCRRLRVYASQTDPRFISVAKFAQTFGKWKSHRADPRGIQHSASQAPAQYEQF